MASTCDCCALIDANKAWSCSEDNVWVWKSMLLSKSMWVFYLNGIVNSCLFAPYYKILVMILICTFFSFLRGRFFFYFLFAAPYGEWLILLRISLEKSRFVRIKLVCGKPASTLNSKENSFSLAELFLTPIKELCFLGLVGTTYDHFPHILCQLQLQLCDWWTIMMEWNYLQK